MYEQYWTLADRPFQNAPDPRYLYAAAGHEEALTRLLFVLDSGGGAVALSGPSGSGKSFLGRLTSLMLAARGFELIRLADPDLDPTSLLQRLVAGLGLADVGTPRAGCWEALESFLGSPESGRGVVLVIDHAHLVSDRRTLLLLPMLLDLSTASGPRLQLLLIGEAPLGARLHSVPELARRVAMRCQLGALTADETAHYVRHRMTVAGRETSPFTEAALAAVHRLAGGLPRQINTLCDHALLLGCGAEATEVDDGLIERAARAFGATLEEQEVG